MALNDLLKKISIENLDCKGIYFKDTSNLFNKSELDKKDLQKINYQHISLVVKFYHRSRTIKKTFKYYEITGLDALKKAIKERYELKEELENTGYIKPEVNLKTLNEVAYKYLDLKKDETSKHNENQRLTYNKWVEKSIGDYNIDTITVEDIQQVINKMKLEKKTPRTQQSLQQILRPIFNYAIKNKLCTENPAVDIKIEKFDNTVDFYLSDEKRKELFKQICEYEPMKYRGIMLFLFMGRRLSEVLKLKWENIFLDEDYYSLEFSIVKNRRRQVYPLMPILKEYLENFNESPKKGYIFKGDFIDHVTSNTFRRHWKSVLENANIESMRIHDTRHLLGGTLVNKGVTEDIIAIVLGHKKYSITSRYSKIHVDTIRSALEIYMEDLI